MSEKIFANGIFFNLPRTGAPEWVQGSLSIRAIDFIDFITMHQKDGLVNLDLLKSKDGTKMYFTLNDYKK